MKKFFMILNFIFAVTLLNAQATDLFFSEYIEGSSNNKAIEIYNGTGSTVDLSQYVIRQSTNGGNWQYLHIFPAGATLADGDVWVMLNSQTDVLLFDPANADEVLAYPSVVHHTGDDARALCKVNGADTTIIDVIGIPTEDPGDGWSVAGIADATKNHSLVRKETVIGGNTDWTVAAGTNTDDSEWIVYDQNTFTYLGAHTMVFEPTSVEVTFQVDMSVKVGNGSFDPTTQVVTVPGGFNNWLNEPPANSEKVMEDADGDYIYTKTIEMEPSTSYQYKYNIGTGWDGLDESSNRTFTSGTSDEVLPVVFYNGTTAGSNSVVTFEVDMSLKAQAGFDPTTENVYVAGSFNGWSTSASQMLDADGDSVYSVVIDSLTVGEEYYFKYIYSGGAVTWEDVENRAFTPTNSEDSYFAWWNNVEEQGNVSDGTIQFQIDMSVMSEAGIYDNFTDSLQVRGNFNGWGDADKMDQDPLNADQWYKSVSFEATEVGSEQNYKYFVLLANASVSNMWTDGWERPFSEGGGNRDVNFEGTETQVVDYVYYDDVQPNWVIPTGTTVSIEFSVNMTVAADPTQQVPTFNPSTDTLWWIAEQPAFTYLMGWTDTDNMKEVMMSDADGDMIYTGTLTVEGPAWNGFEYRYGFSHSLGYTTEPAGYGDFAYRVRFINQAGDREFVQPYSAPVDEWSLVENKEDQWESEPMYVGIDENGTEVATYSLSQNYPNPFNPSTQINFSLASNGLVSLKIYNILGQEVATLINREMTSGVHSFNFDASKLTSGIYFYTLQSGNFTATKKMIFLK